jgi:transglutaminase-like putative cysteine protease
VQYLVRHLTRFVYTAPVCESIMELRMQPLDRERQRCLRFALTTSERTKVFAYRDHYGNAVHYFDIPGPHTRLELSAEAVVAVEPLPALPAALALEAWDDLDRAARGAEYDDWLAPSHFVEPTPSLVQFARAIGFDRRHDPLTALRLLMRAVFTQFAYEPRTTRVDSPIDEALRARAGVCQDFAHIMTALARRVAIPCRYVSGYLAPIASEQDRSADNATHAWTEAFLPTLGWVGFDPTNNVLAGERHVATAIGRDYADVPPTRGVFKGHAGSELTVAVAVTAADAPIVARTLTPGVSWISPPPPDPAPVSTSLHQQQQQQ